MNWEKGIRKIQKNAKQGKYKKGIRLFSFGIAGICIFLLGMYYAGGFRAERNIEDLRKIKAEASQQVSETPQEETSTGEEMLPEYQELYLQNPDLAGWLTISGTKIDYPVMSTPEDPEFYSHRGFDKEESANGLLFLDENSYLDEEGANVIIYGHNMKNGSMFADLISYENEAFAQQHPVIELDTLYEKRTYEVVSVMKSADVSLLPFDFTSLYSDRAQEVLENVKSHALYTRGDPFALGEDFLTLSTCEYGEKDGRLVVFARRKL